jgi:DNA polymerase-1
MISIEGKKLFLLDAYALIYRAYYAFINNPRINSKGQNTSAAFGFTNTLLEILEKEKPSHIAVVFDPPQETFRSQEFAAYKAHREEMPEDIRLSIPSIMKIIEGFRIPVLMVEGFEADDVIGTLAIKAQAAGFTTYMMTPDKDYGQLVTDTILIFKPGRFGNPSEVLGPSEVCEKFGVDHPRKVIDVLGLMGDKVDNIPGIPGFGEKTAIKYINQYGSVEGLLEHAEELKGKHKELVEQYAEQALLSKRLATIITDVPVELEEDRLIMEEPDKEILRQVLAELEFRALAKRIMNEGLQATGNPSRAGSQISLFTEDIPEENTPSISEVGSIETTPHDYRIADDELSLGTLKELLSRAKEFCFDTETSDLDSVDAEIVGMSFSVEPGKAWYVPTLGSVEDRRMRIHYFNDLFENSEAQLIAQNYKFDYKILKKYGIKPSCRVFDTMIAHYLLNPEMRHGMDYLSETYLHYRPISIESLLGKRGKNQGSMADLTPTEVLDYAAEDADITLQLKHVFDGPLAANNQARLFREIEVPLIEVLAEMEMEGVSLDASLLKDYSATLETEASELEKKIWELAGGEFNVDSPRQLGQLLFEKLKIDSNFKKTKSGQYSTNEEILNKLKDTHPIVNLILEYRQVKKLKSTYVDPLPEMVHPKTGRLHTSYMQTVAATGRLSSNHPNLQNIPIRTERGRQIRKAFISRGPDYLLLSADYSQVELRIIAALSGDEHMMAAFHSGADIHASTAARVFGVPLEEVDREMRSKAKAVNFGIIYGQSAFGLSQNLNIKRAEAKEIIDSYFAKYPGIRLYIDKSIQEAREKGFVETVMGRRRYLPDINSANAVVRGFAERNAINAPLQGSAADIIKKAMIDIYRDMEKMGLLSRMIMQVHDELVFDCHKDEVEIMMGLVKDRMENAYTLPVPLKVDLGTGLNWLEAH